ncbi:MAG TPA: DUF6519 domain-containing protein, partial [Xanthomonadales bacterium]|nr:DUF6519 domain-containing protein [Xanthomonadales bacterium]
IKVAAWTVDGVAFAKDQYVQITGDTSAATPPATTSLTAKIAVADYPTSALTLDTAIPAKLQKATNVRAQRLVTYASQPGLPQPPPLDFGKNFQLYVDVWERLITSLEDDSIREVALNGPDTAARTQVVWQIRATPLAQASADRNPDKTNAPLTQASCMTAEALEAILDPVNAGLMRAQTQPGQVSTDPCTISPDSQYRGPENQLYRVEIHDGTVTGSDSKITFKWSRENGSVVFPILGLATTAGTGVTQVTLANLGRDDRFSLQTDDYVEIQDDRSVLANTPGPLLQVQSVDRATSTVWLNGTVAGTLGSDVSLHPLLRRWDQKAGDPGAGGVELVAGAVVLVADRWLNLEDGVQVQFPGAGSSTFRTGDYWLVPARVATGDVIWPRESWKDNSGAVNTAPIAKPPDGVQHYYAPLALVALDGAGAPTVTPCQVPLKGQ